MFILYIYMYIYKEELKTVVRELLVCAQPNRHETFPALWNPYHRVSSRGRRAKICYSRGARAEKPENDRPPFWFYRESIRTSVHGSHIVIWKHRHRNAIVWMHHSSGGSSPKGVFNGLFCALHLCEPAQKLAYIAMLCCTCMCCLLPMLKSNNCKPQWWW